MSSEAGESWKQAGRLERAGSKLGGWRELGASWEQAGARGVSWSKLGGWRELGASWEAGESSEQAGSELEQGK